MSDDIGGEWTAEWRHLHVEAAGWLDARDVRQAMGGVREAALRVDRDLNKGNLWQLQQACQRLERESARYRHRLTKLHEQIGYLVAAVVQTRALNPDLDDRTDWGRHQQQTEKLLAESELGLDRLAAFYGVNGKAER